jgi:malyl-CoA/(S)-citramalyl-CoA lyase
VGGYAVLVALRNVMPRTKGAVTLDGRLIDIASIKQAEVLVQKAKQIADAG